jgi:MYXO-CTERM domain-containing protein
MEQYGEVYIQLCALTPIPVHLLRLWTLPRYFPKASSDAQIGFEEIVMKTKHIALAGALLLGVPAPAAFADTVETVASYGATNIDKTTASANLTTGLFKVLADTDYIFSVHVGTTKEGGTKKFLVASLLDALDNVISSFTIQSNPSTSKSKSYTSVPLILAEGFYKIVFAYNTQGASNPKFFSTSASLTHTVQAVPVPGPEAGAGIGALGMAGLAYIAMKRRRSFAA